MCDLALSVFEVCFVDLDAIFERADFFPRPFPGVPLSASPASWFLPLEGLRIMLLRPCAKQDADFLGVVEFVVV